MLSKNKFRLSAFIWLVLVFSFSLIYWEMWKSRPDTFIFNKEFNLNPIDYLDKSLWSEDVSSASSTLNPSSSELDFLMREYLVLDKDAAELKAALLKLSSQKVMLESERKAAFDRHEKLLLENVEKYKVKALSAESKEVAELEASEDNLERQFGPSPDAHNSVVLAKKRVDLAHARVRQSKKALEVGESVIRDYGRFADREASANAARLDNELYENYRQENELNIKLMEVRRRSFEVLKRWYMERGSRLEWADFLYFSAGVSTSTTFGDIIPNTRFARVVTLIQLILNIFLVGYMVSLIGSGDKSKGAIDFRKKTDNNSMCCGRGHK